MRLKTRLVLAATTVTFAIVIVLSVVFMGELLRQRIAETAANNVVMVRQVLQMTRQAVQQGLAAHPPADSSQEALNNAVADALRAYQPLTDTMDGIVLYSPTVQDVSVTDAHGWTLVSTDPLTWNQQATSRRSLARVSEIGLIAQAREFFGPPRVLDVSLPLERNGQPFLVAHIGVRSTFLKATYVPRLKDALLLAVLSGGISMALAALLAAVSLRPIEDISRKLEQLTDAAAEDAPSGIQPLEKPKADAMVRVTATIDRLGRQIRSTEAGYTDLQTNLNQMLDTLREGVVLFTPDGRAAMISEAVANFGVGVPADLGSMPERGDESRSERDSVGRDLSVIFSPQTSLGAAIARAFARPDATQAETVRLEDGREVEFSLDRFADGAGSERMGTLLTLRDTGSAQRLEQEFDVSRRLAAIGRLTAGVGHEVKNPINAMVVHLELLRAKLAAAGQGSQFLEPTMRHVDVLAGEMQRLDRVVGTLADFTRPMELHPREVDLAQLVEQVVELTRHELQENHVQVVSELSRVTVHADGELMRQAMLNLVLNGAQAMPEGGILRLTVERVKDAAVVRIQDEGEGIAPEVLPRIFDLYFTTKASGSGIGLAMTYRIVQMHGGSMEVASEPGHGASFTLRLPAVIAESKGAGKTPTQLLAGRMG